MSELNSRPRSDGVLSEMQKQLKWSNITPVIEDLYITENISSKVFREMLETLYDFTISQSQLSKRCPKRNDRRNGNNITKKPTRVTAIKKRTPTRIDGKIIPLIGIRYNTTIPTQPVFLRYRPQERLFYSIHHFLDSMFHGGQSSWSVHHVGFLSSDGREAQLRTWMHIEAQCDSISTFIRCNQLSHAKFLLSKLSHWFERLARFPDPLFLGRIWRLALVLRGFDRRAPQFKAVSTILGKLRNTCFNLQGKDCPISTITNSLTEVEEIDFMATMRLGFRMTLMVLDERINDENMLVLQLWSTYAQYFCRDRVKSVKKKRKDTKERYEQNPQNQPRSEAKASRLRNSVSQSQYCLKDHIQKEVLWRKFLLAWNDCYNTNYLPVEEWRDSEACILMSCYYSYACFWVCDQRLRGEESARDVLGYTESCFSQSPVWSSKIMAFGIAVKIVATSYHDRGDSCQAELLLEDAIKKLSCGDEGCLNKAIGLCLTLGSWRHKRKDLEGYREVEQQLSKIQSGIEGMKMCPNCRPKLKCQECFQDRANCKKCLSESRRKVCRTCKNAGTRRRRIIDMQNEHWLA